MFHQSRSWYAVHVKTNFEKVAATMFQVRTDLACFMRCDGRTGSRCSERPLVPWLCVCWFIANDRLPVLTTTGVLSVVGSGRTLFTGG